MQSKNIGFIIYTKKIKENDLYIKILSASDTIVSGIVYGGNSSKKRLIYQPGFFIEYNQLQKNINSINLINGEITKPFVGVFFEDKLKSFLILSLISILNEYLYDEEKIGGLFISVNKLINSININNDWLYQYFDWLLHFLKLLGYEIDYISNYNIKYFNLNSLRFQENSLDNFSILFPHKLFKKNRIITYESVNSLFKIFESVFEKNHLNKFNNKMPLNYLNFKTIILKKLNKRSYE